MAMKRAVAVFGLICLCWCSSSAEATSYLAGDANADSVVDAADVVYEISYLFRDGPPPVFWECGDPTADCVVDAADVVYLIAYLFREGPQPQIVECGWSEPVNVGPVINSDEYDCSISFSADWKRLILASNRHGTHGCIDVWYSWWDDESESWTVPVNCGISINTSLDDRDPCISADGNEIYYSAWGRPGGCGSWDLWVSTWDSVNGYWGVPENLGPSVNYPGMDWMPFITPDGNKVYFSSNRYPGGIFVSEQTGGEWGIPTWLGPNVNVDCYEEDPAVTADGNVLYFVRWIVEEGTGVIPRIWVSYWTETDWGPSFMLPPSINYPGFTARGPWITPDGRKLYFSGGLRPGDLGGGDIWVSERIPIQEGKRFINREQDLVRIKVADK
jgi:hypothetical protein